MSGIGKAVADWAKEALVIPAGHPDAGKQLILPDYMVRFFDAVFQDGVIEGGMSIARKNIKSTGCAVLLLYFLVGPGYAAGWRAAVLATDGKIARDIRALTEGLADASGLLVESRYEPQPGKIVAGNAEVQYFNSGNSSGLSGGYDLVVCDEMGEYDEKARELVGRFQTSMPLRDGRLIGIGCQAHGALFQEFKDRALLDTTVWHEFSGDPRLPIDDEDNLRAGNPAIDAGIMQLGGLLKMARRSKGNAADTVLFQKYHLNILSQPPSELLLTLPEYREKVVVDELPPRGGLCSLGVDIGYTDSLCAAAAFWRETGRLEIYHAAPESPSLEARGVKDGLGALYSSAYSRGQLWLHPGEITDAGAFIEQLADVLIGEDVEMIADDYRAPEVYAALDRARLNWFVDIRRVGRGKDSMRDIIETQKLLKSGAVKTLENLLLANAIRHATLRFSSSNNFCELVRHRSNSRIDSASALVLALGHAGRLLASVPDEPFTFTVM